MFHNTKPRFFKYVQCLLRVNSNSVQVCITEILWLGYMLLTTFCNYHNTEIFLMIPAHNLQIHFLIFSVKFSQIQLVSIYSVPQTNIYLIHGFFHFLKQKPLISERFREKYVCISCPMHFTCLWLIYYTYWVPQTYIVVSNG